MSSNLNPRSLLDELRNFDKGGFFDLGHPLLNRIVQGFVKAAGIGAAQAVSREAYFMAIEGSLMILHRTFSSPHEVRLRMGSLMMNFKFVVGAATSYHQH
ncbi:hypothetical protein QN277_023758 [Acacia crassicarpa]|uniref:Uncharacterized protein n=1 Tax=Acacia crassicarpa TaxID=499986 RepID=A0AAE1JC69_9FABA|nr:hypothetical protein QN277_023758 [Acacia crassicarpa]